MEKQQIYHKPVLVQEVLEYLKPSPHKTYVDCTFGGGGHTRAILEAEPTCKVVALDWDTVALEKNGGRLMEEFPDRLTLVWGNFANMLFLLKRKGIHHVDGILADFGTSQFQIKEKAGFSFGTDTLLDMRMSPAHQKLTAAQVINHSSPAKLREIFFTYGEEPYTNKIVQAIVEARAKKQFKTTQELVAIIEKIVPQGRSKTHPATKVFQALRIHVNDELGNINSFLHASMQLLNKDGRIVCISFHSLEDRLVKQFFLDHKASSFQKGFEILTPKVVTATEEELSINPSSRSAKLRAARLC